MVYNGKFAFFEGKFTPEAIVNLHQQSGQQQPVFRTQIQQHQSDDIQLQPIRAEIFW